MRRSRPRQRAAAPPRFANAAIGGGTPTFLEAAELSRLFDILERAMGARIGAIPLSVEASPATASTERLAVLAERGTTRLSLGVQSFDAAEARAAVRPFKTAQVHRALAAIRESKIPILNIDLIYGIDGQTEESWLASLDAALTWRPEELYLYPLYVRPLTGLARVNRVDGSAAAWDAQRLRLYRAGRDHLLARGYRQVSMRMFQRLDAPAIGGEGDYACQSDGMVGLGCGARSYTTVLHYSFDYAVSAGAVRGIIDQYTATEDFTRAAVGYRLDAREQRRRHLLQSLLQAEGLDEAEYAVKFGAEARAEFAEPLELLREHGLLEDPPPALGEGRRLRLTPEGLAWSDAVGPLLFSEPVRAAMRAYALK